MAQGRVNIIGTRGGLISATRKHSTAITAEEADALDTPPLTSVTMALGQNNPQPQNNLYVVGSQFKVTQGCSFSPSMELKLLPDVVEV